MGRRLNCVDYLQKLHDQNSCPIQSWIVNMVYNIGGHIVQIMLIQDIIYDV